MSGMGPEAEAGDISCVIEKALEMSDLPVPGVPPEIGSMGEEPSEVFMVEMLSNAGIVVESLTENIHPDERKFEFMQIVDQFVVVSMMDPDIVKDDDEVQLADMADMLGFQVKLNGTLMWKVKVMLENKEHHFVNRARSGRQSTADPSSIFQNHELHEIYVPCEGEMYSTVAVSNTVVITVLFQINEEGKCEWDKGTSGNLPPIMQRRVDMIFHNKYCARLQVRVLCSVFCVLCSAFCVLCSVFCVLCSVLPSRALLLAADCLHGRLGSRRRR